MRIVTMRKIELSAEELQEAITDFVCDRADIQWDDLGEVVLEFKEDDGGNPTCTLHTSHEEDE